MVYHPKTDKEKAKASLEKATFKSHMFSQKERERKTSASTLSSHRDKHDGLETYSYDYQGYPSIPPAVIPPMLTAPAACLTYNARVSWKLRVKKEVFRPNEATPPPAVIDILYSQIITDILGPSIRIAMTEKKQALNFLKNQGIDLNSNPENARNMSNTNNKRILIEMARCNNYFMSSF